MKSRQTVLQVMYRQVQEGILVLRLHWPTFIPLGAVVLLNTPSPLPRSIDHPVHSQVLAEVVPDPE